ncbi:MAG: hypothetical protein IJJ33_01655 [Victivallales bacterium]|nr:hypothetical protein [Victivallales bacterium]
MSCLSKHVWLFLVGCLLCVAWCAAETIDSPQEVGLRNSLVEISFDKADYSLRRIRDRIRGVDYVHRPGGTLFSLTFGFFTTDQWRTTTDFTITGKSASSRRHEWSATERAEVLRLYLDCGPLDIRGARSELCITGALPHGSPLTFWNLEVDNHSGTPLKEVRFPLLDGLASSAKGSELTDYVAVPLYNGARYASPRKKLVTGQEMSNYPMSGGLTFQMLFYGDGQGGGLYFAAHDPGSFHKTFDCRPSGDDTFRMTGIHYAESDPTRIMWDFRRPHDDGTPIGKWRLPYPVVVGAVQGDWYDACKLYRAWTLGNDRWRPFSRRKDVSERFRSEIMLIRADWGRPAHPIRAMVDGRPNQSPEFVADCRRAMDEAVRRHLELQDALETKVATHFYMWYKAGEHDLLYPDYFPALPGVKEGFARIRAAGGAVMPYVQALLFDSAAPQFEQARPYFKLGLDGQIVNPGKQGLGLLRKSGGWGGMCFATEWWQDFLTGVYRTLKEEYSCDSCYLDLLYSSQSFCFDHRHGHTIPGGNFFGQGALALTKKVKGLYPPGEAFLMGENLGESYIGVVDAQLVMLPENDPHTLPMFTSVYSDRVSLVGVYDTVDSALCFELAAGRMFYLHNDALKLHGINMPLLKRLVHARRAALDYLHDGEQLRSPDMSRCATVRTKWRVPLKGKDVEYEVPAVFASAWRSPRGGLAFVFANHTSGEQNVAFPWNERDWGYAPGLTVARSECVNGNWGKAFRFVLPREFAMTVPPSSAVVVQLVGVKPCQPSLGVFSRVAEGAENGCGPRGVSEDSRFNPDNEIYRSR